MTLPEWERLIASVSNRRDYLLLRILYETGCTVNEVVHMRREHINTQDNTILFHAENTRNCASRNASISEELAAMLKEFLDSHDLPFVLSSRQSGMITTRRVRQIVQYYSQKAGLPTDYGPQTLRYTHIIHAALKQIPLASIQSQVGMGSTRVQEILSHITDSTPQQEYRRFFQA